MLSWVVPTVLLAAMSVLVTPIFTEEIYKSYSTDSCLPDGVKINCLPDKNLPTEEDCLARGCCWQATSDNSPNSFQCHYRKNHPGYTVRSVKPREGALEATLEKTSQPSGFPDDVLSLTLSVQFINKNILRIKIYDNKNKRFEPPFPVIDLALLSKPDKQQDYDVRIVPDPMSFNVTRKSTNEVLFDTSSGAFIFADQFLQLTTLLSTTNLYGLGEHINVFNRGGKAETYTIFNRGELVPMVDTGFNLYGSHPFYLALEKSGKAHGVFLHNSNAMDIVVQPNDPSLTYRTIGGILDFYFFLGPSPDEVVEQYTSLVGRPFLVPYWTLGFHLCRYGYNTTEETKLTWQRNVDAKIPLDAMWSDIDYMDHMKDFTFGPKRMNGIGQFINELHADGMHYIMNNSPGISGVEPKGTYPPLDEAKELDIIIKDYKGDYLEALVWQNVTYMLDFSNPKIDAYWEKNFRNFHQQLSFDGAWIDMNEPYSFISGSHYGCPSNNSLDHPPYVPGGQELFNGTICLSAQQFLSTHYNLHTLYAIMETRATNLAITSILGRRPFVLSRASSPGHGFWGAHWSGDIHSTWEHLRYSIPNMLNFNLYGIPMIGSDICGFVGNTNVELCVRWMQLGAFYPFSRNHNDFDTIPQDPASFSKDIVDIMREALKTRYYLLPFLYTIMHHSHTHGTPAIRPLFFDFPEDKETHNNDRQFLWGKALMVVPVVEEGVTSVSAYLPSSVWYDLHNGTFLESQGQYYNLSAPLDRINVLVKAGHVIPAQEPGLTTTESRKNPFHLIVALDSEGQAEGDLVWDDGDSLESITGEKFNHVIFSCNQNTLRSTVAAHGYETEMLLGQIKIYGIKNVTDVAVNMQTLQKNQYEFLQELKVLTIKLENLSILKENIVSW